MLKKIKFDLLSNFVKKFFSYLLLFCFVLVFLFISFKNMFLLFLMFLCILCLFLRKIKIRNFVVFLFIVSFIIRIIVVLLVETPIMSDFAVMYNTAVKILTGDMSYTVNSNYMNTWGYQMGHTMYLYFLLKIFNSVTFLKLVNCFVTSLIPVLIYFISKEFSSEKSSKVISLIYCFFPFPLFLNSVLTNQHVPALLILISFYLVIGKKFSHFNDIFKYFIVGFLLALANILRPEGIVFITSFIVYFVLMIRKSNFKVIVKRCFVLLLTYFLVFNSCSYFLKVTGYSRIGLENKNFLWKFVVGLNHETNGVYSSVDAEKYGSIGNDDEKLELIKTRIIDEVVDLPRLFLAKSTILWTRSDLSWSLYYLDGKKIEKLGLSIDGSFVKDKLTNLNQYFIYFSLILMVIGIIPGKGKISDNKNLFVIVLLVFFAVYLLTEIMPRYAYTPQLFVFILASIGLDNIFKYLKLKKII